MEVVALVEVGQEVGAGGVPGQEGAGQCAGGGHVGSEEAAQPAEVLLCVVGRDGGGRQAQASPATAQGDATAMKVA